MKEFQSKSLEIFTFFYCLFFLSLDGCTLSPAWPQTQESLAIASEVLGV